MVLATHYTRDGIPTSYKLSGVDLREFGFEVEGHPESLSPGSRSRRSSIANRHGEWDSGSLYSTRAVRLSGFVWGQTHAECMTKIDNLNEWLLLPQDLQEFHMNGAVIRGLKLEITGHQYSESRYLIVNVEGDATITGLYRAHFKGRAYNVTIPLMASYPFWVSDPITDSHRDIEGGDWIRVPKTSGNLGTAETYPELHVAGPVGDSPFTIAHGKYGAFQRFNSISKIDGSSGGVEDTIDVDMVDIYGDSFSGELRHRMSTESVASSESVGSGNDIGVYGNVVGNVGDMIKVPLRRGNSILPTSEYALPSRLTDFFNGDRGTFTCFFKPLYGFEDGVSPDTRTHTMLSIGMANSTSYQLRIRFRLVGSVMKAELSMTNTGATQSVTN